MLIAQHTKELSGDPYKDTVNMNHSGLSPEVKLCNFQSFTLDNGLKVFLAENNKLPRVLYSLTIGYTPIVGKNGLSYLTGQLLRTGTKSMTREVLDENIDFIGASITTNNSNISASGLKRYNEKILQFLSDILLNPDFKYEELEKLKSMTISEAQRNDPSTTNWKVSNQLMFGKDHPYGDILNEELIKKYTVQDCQEFYNTYYKPQVSYLAIVGDISIEEAKETANKYFGKWQKSVLKPQSLPKPCPPVSNVLTIVDRPDAVQTLLSINYPVDITPNSDEAFKARVMNTILGVGPFRLYQNLREQKGYTYGAYSRLSMDKHIGSFIVNTEIRNSVTDSALNEIYYEMNRLREEIVTEEELMLAKNYMAGRFLQSLENPQNIASYAINIANFALSEDYYKNYMKRLMSVTAGDVKEMANKYLLPSNTYILAIGRASEITNKLQPFTKCNIRYFDINANEYFPE